MNCLKWPFWIKTKKNQNLNSNVSLQIETNVIKIRFWKWAFHSSIKKLKLSCFLTTKPNTSARVPYTVSAFWKHISGFQNRHLTKIHITNGNNKCNWYIYGNIFQLNCFRISQNWGVTVFIASSHNLRGRIETPFRASGIRPHLPRRGSCRQMHLCC